MGDDYHWYDSQGRIVEGADLREARKQHLLPSVTSVLKSWQSAGLDIYKQAQLVKAAWQLRPEPNESAGGYGRRIIELSRKHAKDAADFGIRCHHEIHLMNVARKSGTFYTPLAELESFCLPWADFADKNSLEIKETEVAFALPTLGIAGTIDCVVLDPALGMVIDDYKFSGVKERNGKPDPQFYPYYLHQLAAYAVLYQTANELPEPPRIRSHIFDSQGSGHYHQLWSVEDQQRGWKFMQALITCWQIANRYNPSIP